MGLYFVCAAGPCQRRSFWVRVFWYSRPYFTVSDLRLPILSPLTTRRVTVEVFDPASTRVLPCNGSWTSLYSLGTYRTENTVSNNYLIVVCYTVVSSQWLCLWLHSSCFEQICHNNYATVMVRHMKECHAFVIPEDLSPYLQKLLLDLILDYTNLFNTFTPNTFNVIF
jgi:hypothetical protein